MHDSTLVAQVAEYEKTIADLRHTVDQQSADYEATIAKQTAQIATLNSKVDTMTHREHVGSWARPRPSPIPSRSSRRR